MTDDEITALWEGAKAELARHSLEMFAIRAKAIADAQAVTDALEEAARERGD